MSGLIWDGTGAAIVLESQNDLAGSVLASKGKEQVRP